MSLDALFAAVYASPDDDVARAVLADALSDAGDLRGELIALQLREHAGDDTPLMRERTRTLVQEHGALWLGELRPVVWRAAFRRGFLQMIVLRNGLTAQTLDRAADASTLATVEEVGHALGGGESVARMLAGRVAATVRRLHVTDDASWHAIATTPLPQLRGLYAFGRAGALDEASRLAYEQRFEHAIVPFVEARVAITELGCETSVVPRLPRAVLERLERLTVNSLPLEGVIDLWQQLPRLRRLVFAGGAELLRDGTRERLRSGSMVLDLSMLPRTITRVDVYDHDHANRLRAKHGDRFEIEVIWPSSGYVTQTWAE